MPVQWDDALAADEPGGGRRLIYRLEPGEQVDAVLLDRPHGVWGHWLPNLGPHGRTLPCTGSGCAHCRAEVGKWRYWYASASLLLWPTDGSRREWQQWILALTHGARQALGDRARRGLRIELARDRHSHQTTAVITGENLERLPAPAGQTGDPLPEAHDARTIRAALYRLWGLPSPETAEPRDVLPWPKRQRG